MAACQSFPLCAPLGLLLPLLIGVISFHLPEVQAKPIDFWCNFTARKYTVEKIGVLKQDMADCVGYDTLSSPAQQPCDGLNATAWASKTSKEEKLELLHQAIISRLTRLQQKHAEVVGSLQMFQGWVQEARNQSTLQCQTTLLGRLEHHIRNYLAIVNRLPIQNGMGTPAQAAVQAHSSPTSLNKVLEKCGNLITEKLERLATDLQDSMCKDEHKTTNT